jgi:RNA polymerase sigma factor (sigma-70 family)
VLYHLRRVAGAPGECAASDRQLLERFALGREEAAFAALVQRHGPLVWGVCRRLLGNQHDAEDAFQAAFLVLARKAGSIAWRASVANWLYGVAYRVASRARAERQRRRAHERQAAWAAQTESPPTGAWQELRQVLDEELRCLPDKYRAPMVLCYLEGKTRDEAAQQLGWTPARVKTRLERGRELLRGRLHRRGLTLSAALVTSALAHDAMASAVPVALAASTTQGATLLAGGFAATAAGISPQASALTQGALQAMALTKLKLGAAVLLAVIALVTGTALLTHRALPDAQETGLQPEGSPLPTGEGNQFRQGAAQDAGADRGVAAAGRIEPYQVLTIRVMNALPDQPISGPHLVEPEGAVDLGPAYGRVKVTGLSLAEAGDAVAQCLRRLLKDPKASVTLAGWERDWHNVLATASDVPQLDQVLERLGGLEKRLAALEKRMGTSPNPKAK